MTGAGVLFFPKNAYEALTPPNSLPNNNIQLADEFLFNRDAINGTYVAVEPYHLDRYLDEQMFRFNNRIGHTDGTRSQKALAKVGGKRLTWIELTGKEAAPVA
jgi:hypothetical protein